jgi:Domain of unknown function (DUF4327)
MLVIERYSLADFQDEVRALVARGVLGRQQRIYELRGHFDDRAWKTVEQILNLHEYSLKDRITDLVSKESWTSD